MTYNNRQPTSFCAARDSRPVKVVWVLWESIPGLTRRLRSPDFLPDARSCSGVCCAMSIGRESRPLTWTCATAYGLAWCPHRRTARPSRVSAEGSVKPGGPRRMAAPQGPDFRHTGKSFGCPTICRLSSLEALLARLHGFGNRMGFSSRHNLTHPCAPFARGGPTRIPCPQSGHTARHESATLSHAQRRHDGAARPLTGRGTAPYTRP